MRIHNHHQHPSTIIHGAPVADDDELLVRRASAVLKRARGQKTGPVGDPVALASSLGEDGAKLARVPSGTWENAAIAKNEDKKRFMNTSIFSAA
jgi:hypothetical protein